MPSIGQENLETIMIDFFGALRRGDFRQLARHDVRPNGAGLAQPAGSDQRQSTS